MELNIAPYEARRKMSTENIFIEKVKEISTQRINYVDTMTDGRVANQMLPYHA